MPLIKTPRTILATQSNAAGATVRAAIDLNAVYGGLLTLRIANGATGPTVQCVGNVHVAHSATLPETGPAGAVWKTVYSFGGGVAANVVTELVYQVPDDVMALQVEYTGNTGQPVTVEALLSELTSPI